MCSQCMDIQTLVTIMQDIPNGIVSQIVMDLLLYIRLRFQES